MRPEIPCIKDHRGTPTLFVDGEPFLILGGELHNSSASSLSYLEENVWPNLRGLHLNTAVLPLCWEDLEPEENRFSFALLDGILAQARREGLRLVLLWFGLWKNGESMYVPAWMKEDKRTYFPARDQYGAPLPTISPFCAAAVERDKRAFSALMAHLRQADQERTVILVQVENEIGILGSDRDYCPQAEERFAEPVPPAAAKRFQVCGTWREAFGPEAGEHFMAYWFSKAVEEIAGAGKTEYPLPLYVNAWLEQFPWRAGTYPSGGPTQRMAPMWRLNAPSISLYAPDIYVPYAPQVMEEYARPDNPLFIPELRQDASSATYALYAFAGCGALGVSPFGIEELQMDPEKTRKIAPEVAESLHIDLSAFDCRGTAGYLGRSYELLEQIKPLLLEHRGTENLRGFIRRSPEEPGALLEFEDYDLQIDYARRGPNTPEAGGMVIRASENVFYILGVLCRFRFLEKLGSGKKVEYLRVEEGGFREGAWVPGRVLNGDERVLLHLGDMPQLLRVRVSLFDARSF